MEGRPAALGSPPVPSTVQPQDGLSRCSEGAQGTVSHLDLAPATTLARTYATPAASPGTEAPPPLMGSDAWQPKCTQAPVSLVPVLMRWPCPSRAHGSASPVLLPRWLLPWWFPSSLPIQIFSLLPGQLQVATLVPLSTTWMSVMAGGPDPNMTLTGQAQNPFYYCSGRPCFP